MKEDMMQKQWISFINTESLFYGFLGLVVAILLISKRVNLQQNDVC